MPHKKKRTRIKIDPEPKDAKRNPNSLRNLLIEICNIQYDGVFDRATSDLNQCKLRARPERVFGSGMLKKIQNDTAYINHYHLEAFAIKLNIPVGLLLLFSRLYSNSLKSEILDTKAVLEFIKFIAKEIRKKNNIAIENIFTWSKKNNEIKKSLNIKTPLIGKIKSKKRNESIPNKPNDLKKNPNGLRKILVEINNQIFGGQRKIACKNLIKNRRIGYRKEKFSHRYIERVELDIIYIKYWYLESYANSIDIPTGILILFSRIYSNCNDKRENENIAIAIFLEHIAKSYNINEHLELQKIMIWSELFNEILTSQSKQFSLKI